MTYRIIKGIGGEGKKVSDLVGWESDNSPGADMKGLFDSSYRVFRSPDGSQIALVHLNDLDVAIIIDRKERKILYIHPVTEMGMALCGVSREALERYFQRSKF